MKKSSAIRLCSFILIGIGYAMIAISYFIFKENVIRPLLIMVTMTLAFVLVSISTGVFVKERVNKIEDSLDKSMKDIIDEAKIGILVFNDEYEITYVSDLFKQRQLDKTGEKLLTWLPELDKLLKATHKKEIIIINDEKYEVSKKEEANTLLFKDISKEYDLELKNKEDAYVLGLVNYDNYDEASESEEDISYINSNIKVKVIEYFKNFNIEYKTLRNNRLLLILNERKFKELLDDRFSILNTVRNESKKADILITLSMAFSRGSDDLVELDHLVSDLIEIAQTRGGDQVVSRIIGEEAVFYGGASEAREKQSKVKVRAIASTLKDLIEEASNVIIVGHNESDADSIGSAIVISKIIHSLNKDAYIVFDENKTENMILDVINKYIDDIKVNHRLVDENEAIGVMDNDSLVIMVDHHSRNQSLAPIILRQAKHLVLIDHHRRGADLDVNPTLLYVEAGASSTSELVVEFLPYISRRGSLSSLEANLAYLGIKIDTNNFRVRTDSRTFEVAKFLKDCGADPFLCDNLAQEPYENLKKRSEIIQAAKEYKNGILVCMMNGIFPRSIASQACDTLVKTKGVKAAFVLCNISKDEVAITARSNGEINVQTIMEAMNGGGHMTAAGLQKKDGDIILLAKELKENIDKI